MSLKFEDIGSGRAYNADCFEVMKEIPDGSVDMILCDPPYQTTACHWDFALPFEKMWDEFHRIIKNNGAMAIFGSEPFSSKLRMSNLPNWKYDWYWEKERLTNIAQVKKRAGKTVETISLFYKNQCVYNPQMQKYGGPLRTNKVKNGKMGKLTDSGEKKVTEYKDTGFRYPTQVLRFQRDCLTCNLHPTQKPVELCEYLIKTYTNKGDLVFDPTAGSLTTAVAAQNTNRKWIVSEQLEEYFTKGIARFKKSG